MSHLTRNELAALVSHLTEKWSFWKGRRADKAAEYLRELKKADRELQKRLK